MLLRPAAGGSPRRETDVLLRCAALRCGSRGSSGAPIEQANGLKDGVILAEGDHRGLFLGSVFFFFFLQGMDD